jgi:hypothetical protein
MASLYAWSISHTRGRIREKLNLTYRLVVVGKHETKAELIVYILPAHSHPRRLGGNWWSYVYTGTNDLIGRLVGPQ